MLKWSLAWEDWARYVAESCSPRPKEIMRTHEWTLQIQPRKDHAMGWRDYEYDRKLLTADELRPLMMENHIFTVSGLSVTFNEMISGGWLLSVTRNRYGGRLRVAFRSNDGRSVLLFRLPHRVQEANAFFNEITTHTLRDFLRVVATYSKTQSGTMNAVPKPFAQQSQTDEEILTALAERITAKANKLRRTRVQAKKKLVRELVA